MRVRRSTWPPGAYQARILQPLYCELAPFGGALGPISDIVWPDQCELQISCMLYLAAFQGFCLLCDLWWLGGPAPVLFFSVGTELHGWVRCVRLYVYILYIYIYIYC